jgi:hypothetical protein
MLSCRLLPTRYEVAGPKPQQPTKHLNPWHSSQNTARAGLFQKLRYFVPSAAPLNGVTEQPVSVLVSDQQLGGRRRAAGGRAMLPRRRGLDSASCLGHGLARRAMAAGRKGWAASLLGS